MRRAVLLIAIATLFCVVRTAQARTEPGTVDALAKAVERLTRQVEEMASARESDRERIRELEERIERLAAVPAVSAPASAGDAATGGGLFAQGNLLNPQITAFVDAGGSLSTDADNDARNRFTLREAEVDLRGAVSPRADGVLVIAIGEEIEDPFGDIEVDFAFELEEGYLDVHTLPWDLALRAGKFRVPFGRNNLLHTHDLPQVTRPLAVQAFLGPEGLAPVGAALAWLVPNPWDSYVELTAQLLNADGGSESPILIGPGARNPAVLSHLKLFQDIGETGSLELGTSFLYQRASGNFDDGYVVGADATWLWRDPEAADSRSLLFQAELFWSRNDTRDERGRIVRDDNWGFYAFGQYQFAQNWYGGIRYDYTQFPNLEARGRGDSDWGLSAYLSWYVNEALRVRLEYQHLDRDLRDQDPTEDALLLGFTFYIGAHPGHPYWVNR